MDLLKGKRNVLEKTAKVLLEREKIEGEELKAIMEEADGPMKKDKT